MCGTRKTKRRSRHGHGILGHHGLGHGLGVIGHHGVSHSDEEKTTKLTGGIYCFECNYSSNPDKAKFCQNCGSKLYVCPISQMTFRLGDEFSQCPSCKTTFHKHHLDMSLGSNARCPYCQSPLSGVYVGQVGVHLVEM